MHPARGTFLFLADPVNPTWLSTLTDAIAPWGEIETVKLPSLLNRLQSDLPQALLIDASQCDDIISLVEQVHHQFYELPLIVLTASPSRHLLRRVYQAGARDYIKMSLNSQKLQAELRTALESEPE